MTKYTQKELDNAVDKARMEIIEAVKSALNECENEATVLSNEDDISVLLISGADMRDKINEIEEGFIGKSD